MNKKIDVVFISDLNYVQHLTVAITSLLENNLQLVKNIYIINDVTDSLKFKTLIDFVYKKYHLDVVPLKIDINRLEGLSLSHHLTLATYFRLYLSEIIPENVTEILFLDSDIVVIKSIKDIIELDFNNNNNYLYAVDHKYKKEELRRIEEIGNTSHKYFNAGVLYINLQKWRDENVFALFKDILNKYNDKILWADQDVLNTAFQNKWGELDYKYNAFGLSKVKENNDFRIIHYTGSSKPWHFRNKHPYKNLYWKYLGMTPFKWYIPEDLTILNLIKWLIPTKVKEVLKGYK